MLSFEDWFLLNEDELYAAWMESGPDTDKEQFDERRYDEYVSRADRKYLAALEEG